MEHDMTSTLLEMTVVVVAEHGNAPLKKLKEIAMSCVGRNSVVGCGEHGYYQAEVVDIKPVMKKRHKSQV